MDEKYEQNLIRIISALNHPTRIKILYYLYNHGKSNVNNLVDQFGTTQPAISHHLRILFYSRLVKDKQIGKSKYYQLKDNHIKELLEVLEKHIND